VVLISVSAWRASRWVRYRGMPGAVSENVFLLELGKLDFLT